MALVRRCKSLNLKRSCEAMDGCDDLGICFVGCTAAFGRKRIAIASSPITPTESFFDSDCEVSLLESLPQELLVRVLCSVDHEDLGQLILVSKTIKEAALIAKRWHFAFSTPRSKTKGGFRTGLGFDESGELDETEVPNAPMGNRYRKLNKDNLMGLATRLFD